jgi:hypothetical protein
MLRPSTHTKMARSEPWTLREISAPCARGGRLATNVRTDGKALESAGVRSFYATARSPWCHAGRSAARTGLRWMRLVECEPHRDANDAGPPYPHTRKRFRPPAGEKLTVKKKRGKKRKLQEPGVRCRVMDDPLREIEQLLAAASSSESDCAPRELRGVQTELTRLAADVEATRRRLETVRPALAAAQERLARLEAAQPALADARRRLHALEAAGSGLEQVRTRVRTLSPSVESARRALETTATGMLPATRHQMRKLATELEAASRALALPTSILEGLEHKVRALEALEPLLTIARDEVQALEALAPVLETARRDLRALATELEAPRRALDAAIGVFPRAAGPSSAALAG